MEINIDLDDTESNILLFNGVEEVISNRVVKSFLKDFLFADFSVNQKVTIPLNIDNTRETLNKIESLFKKYSINS